MYKCCVLILLVALWSSAPSVNAATRWSKREVALTDSKISNYNTEQASTFSYKPESNDSIETLESLNNKTKQDDEADGEDEKWLITLANAIKDLNAALDLYDEAKATMKGDIRALGQDVKYYKNIFDKTYNNLP